MVNDIGDPDIALRINYPVHSRRYVLVNLKRIIFVYLINKGHGVFENGLLGWLIVECRFSRCLIDPPLFEFLDRNKNKSLIGLTLFERPLRSVVFVLVNSDVVSIGLHCAELVKR